MRNKKTVENHRFGAKTTFGSEKKISLCLTFAPR